LSTTNANNFLWYLPFFETKISKSGGYHKKLFAFEAEKIVENEMHFYNIEKGFLKKNFLYNCGLKAVKYCRKKIGRFHLIFAEILQFLVTYQKRHFSGLRKFFEKVEKLAVSKIFNFDWNELLAL
jgi:hypothetical protein